MIVLAADYVGYNIVDFLIKSKEPISYLILDEKNRGNYNDKIVSIFTTLYDKEKIFYNNKLSDENFLEILENVKPNIGLLAWWPYILKGRILSIPKMGWLNFHPSFLPFNKGKHPNFWCLVDETQSGVSLQFIDEGIDTGDVLARKKILMNWEDTGKTIYEKSRLAIIDLFQEQFQIIKQNPNRVKQNPKEGSTHKSSEIDEICKINLDERYTARKLLNIIRGKMFPPHPLAYFIDNGIKYSVEIKIKEIKDDE